jgi:type II secretory pathway pseudopilin PulG
VIVLPVVGVAVIVKVVVVPAVGFGDAEIVTVGCGLFPTVTAAVAVDGSPKVSIAETRTRNDPATLNVCEIAAGAPVNVDGAEPSPQSTMRRAIGVAFAVLKVNGKVTACPATGEAGVGVPIVTPVGVLTLIVTVAVLGPDEVAGGVVVPGVVPVLGAVVLATPAAAVTVACRFVVTVVCARPLASELTTEAPTLPALVVNVTGTDGKTFPLVSNTVAVTVTVPPAAGTVLGLASSRMPPTAAEPIAILMAPFAPTPTPPDIAVMVAVPEVVPARNFTTTRPPRSVSASDGCMVPSVVVNVTCVPLCGGVPEGSMTCAMMSADPLIGSAVAADVNVMLEPDGASNGTFSQETVSRAALNRAPTSIRMGRRRPECRAKKSDIIETLNILIPMQLHGQARFGQQARNDVQFQSGYAMAALLVAMSIMAVMLTVAMPVWKQMAQREKEEELVFRGTQYARAIGLFQRKYANAYPPNLDVLVQDRFLRKKYKDPITDDDFAPLAAGQAVPTAGPGATTPGGRAGAPVGRGQSSTPAATSPFAGGSTQPGGRGLSPIGTPGAGATAGIMGVTSKSKDKSIRLYGGRNHYNEWQFVYLAQVQAPGGVPGAAVPGQRGQPGQQNPFGGPGVGGRGRGGGRPTGPGTGGPGRGGFGPGANPFATPPPTTTPRGRSGR